MSVKGYPPQTLFYLNLLRRCVVMFFSSAKVDIIGVYIDGAPILITAAVINFGGIIRTPDNAFSNMGNADRNN